MKEYCVDRCSMINFHMAVFGKTLDRFDKSYKSFIHVQSYVRTRGCRVSLVCYHHLTTMEGGGFEVLCHVVCVCLRTFRSYQVYMTLEFFYQVGVEGHNLQIFLLPPTVHGQGARFNGDWFQINFICVVSQAILSAVSLTCAL